jgi:predicted Fe-Mo cluster-binding NifX family protein
LQRCILAMLICNRWLTSCATNSYAQLAGNLARLARDVLYASTMRIAIPVWRDRVSPVFDVAGNLRLVDQEDGAPLQRSDASIQEGDSVARVRKITELGVDLLICGAISRPLESMLTAAGVKVVARICGGVDEVLNAHRSGRLGDPAFAMPGCCGQKRRRHRGSCGRNRGYSDQ